MELKEYTYRDKSGWARGEWDNEPDKIQWTDEETGLPCLIVRNSFGALCGYVGVDKDHPFFEQHYDKCDVSVHGGLTFTDFCQNHEHGVCHIPGPGEPDRVWWLGFDCGHAWDLIPAWTKEKWFQGLVHSEDVYRGMPYVKAEVRQLAKQVKEYGR